MRVVSRGGLWKEEADALAAEKRAEGYNVTVTMHDEGHHWTVSWE
jgi:hypothetical protein